MKQANYLRRSWYFQRIAFHGLTIPGWAALTCGGLLVLGLAYAGAWQGTAWAETFFWTGFLLLLFPTALLLAKRELSRTEQLTLLGGVGFGLYLARLLRNPVALTFTDEMLHWRGTMDVIQTQHLYAPNPLLPIGSYYPGLQLISAALIQTLNSPLFFTGMLVVGAARLLMVFCLYFFYEEVGLSKRAAGLATLLYMANPGFVFFNAMYAYESLALPLAMLCLYSLAKSANSQSLSRRTRIGFNSVAVIALSAATITHHLTSFMLIGFLLLWAVISLISTISTSKRRQPLLHNGTLYWLSGLALLIVGGWSLLATNNLTLRYLTPNLNKGLDELINLATGNTTGRQLFKSYSGQVSPLWEQITAFLCIGIILAGLPLGWWLVWRKFRFNPALLTLAIATLGFPAALGLRLTSFGSEISNRTSEFLYLAIAPVLALVIEYFLAKQENSFGRISWGLIASLLFCGGLIMGFAGWTRLPGAYLVAADTRSFEPQGIEAANWARQTLGTDNRMVSDRVNRLLMGSYGEQRIVTNYGDSLNITTVFFGKTLTQANQALLQALRVRYVVVDRRLSTGLPMAGVYIEQGEPDAFNHRTPLEAAFLQKFDQLEQVNRFFDSGDIQLYDLKNLPNSLPQTNIVARNALLQDTLPVRQTSQVAPENLPDNLLGWLWLLVGVPLFLLLPGYLFCRIAFREILATNKINMLVISLGMSVSLVILGGFGLNWLPGGLQGFSWLVGLAGLCTGLFLVASLKFKSFKSFKFNKPALIQPQKTWKYLPTLVICLFLLALALNVSVQAASQSVTSGFTQLWLDDANVIGLHNFEGVTTKYRLEVWVNNTKQQEWVEVELKTGQKWNVPLTTNKGTTEVKLYKLNEQDTAKVYRQLKIYY